MPLRFAWVSRLLAVGMLLVAPALRAQPAPAPAVAGGSGSNPFKPPTELVRSFAELRTIQVGSDLPQFLEANESLVGSVQPANRTEAAAFAEVRGMFAAGPGAEMLARARREPRLQSVGQLNAAAMLLFANRQGGGAIACLLLATEKAPRDPGAKLNLAAGLLAVGRANEALAVLAAAESLGPLPMGAWGMPGARQAEYLRGYAHLLRGEYPEAKALLTKVAEAEPTLREAALALALAQAKLGEEPRRAFLAGVVRTKARMIARDRPTPETLEEASRVLDGFEEGEAASPSLADLFDLSQGQPGVLPEVPAPQTAVQLMAMVGPYTERFAAAMQQEVTLHNDVVGVATRAFEESAAPRAYKRRQLDLYNAATNRHGGTPELAAAAAESDYRRDRLDQRTQEAIDAATEEKFAIAQRQAKETQGQPMTPALLRRLHVEMNGPADAALGSLGAEVKEYQAAIAREYRLRSSVMHGMLSQVGAPALRTALKASAEEARFSYEGHLLTAVINLSPLLGAIYDPAAVALEEGEAGEGPECEGEAAKFSVSLEFGPAGVEMNCSSVTFELTAEVIPEIFGVSGELGFDVNGEVSLFVGPKESLPGVGSLKQGFYVTASREGVRDIGVKNESKLTAGAGPVKVSYKGEDMTFSFLPGPDPGPTFDPWPGQTGG